jgi:hypothetical protein
MAQEDKQAAGATAASNGLVLASSVVEVDGEWFYCPGEYPQPCVGPFDTKAALAAFPGGAVGVAT